MFVAQVPCKLAILAIFGIIAIFLFPIPRGPYSAVHGPMTALRSLPVRFRLGLGMALAALKVFGCRRLTDCFAPLRTTLQEFLLPLSVPREQNTVLRC